MVQASEERPERRRDADVFTDQLRVVRPIKLIESGSEHADLALAENDIPIRVNLDDLVVCLIAD
jgi:hypothetical protein